MTNWQFTEVLTIGQTLLRSDGYRKVAHVILCAVASKTSTIVHEDQWIIVAAKAVGIPCQPDKTGDTALSDILEMGHGSPLFVVHRIDRPASGLVLFARSTESANHFSELFRSAGVQRRYWAIVASEPAQAEGTLRHRLRRDGRTNKSRVVKEGGEDAVLHYRVVTSSERYWLLEVTLETGRHHQIRAQLAAVGCPIRGDLKYGARRSIPGGGIGLHAYRLAFTHPETGQELTLTAAPPEDKLWHVLTDGLQE